MGSKNIHSATFDIISTFQAKRKEPDMREMDEMAAVMSLMDYLAQDTSTTTLQEFMDNMEKAKAEICLYTSCLAARTTCDLFVRYITLSHNELESATDFQECKKILMKLGNNFIERLKQNSSRVIKEASNIIKDRMVILTHSRSKLILGLMTEAHKRGKYFKVYVTDGQPSCKGSLMVKELQENGIHAEFIYDTEVGSKMDKVDAVLVAAEGICEDGGAVCRVGFFNIALIAKTFMRKVHILVESHKFAQLFTISNRELPSDILYSPKTSVKPGQSEHPLVDFTPAQYVSLIYTDIGTLPTSAVGEFLWDLYK